MGVMSVEKPDAYIVDKKELDRMANNQPTKEMIAEDLRIINRLIDKCMSPSENK